MPKFSTRRLFDWPNLAGRAWEACSQSVEETFEKIARAWEGGIPPGFKNRQPDVLGPNDTGSAGTEGAGWAAADIHHALDLLLSTKGDLLSHNGSIYVRVGQGIIPAGWVLTSDPTSPVGFSWKPPVSTGGGGSTVHSVSDFQLRAAFESLAVRKLIAKTFR